jgi:hypothetical protein
MQDVEHFIYGLPKDEQIIVTRLRTLIFQAEPRLKEGLSYGVPYFFRNRRVFFLWPASAIPCQYRSQHKPPPPNVTIGFCYGNLLSNAQGLLKSEGRKQVYTIDVPSLATLNEAPLREVINEAILIDDQFFRKKKN